MDFSDPGHLPKLRANSRARHPSWLPRQRRGTTPQMIGRYPDFDIMDYADSWDPATRAVVERRLVPHGPLRFFTSQEARCVGAFLDVVLAQDEEPRIPVLSMVDAKLADGRMDGYQYASMPDDRDTWRVLAEGLDQAARRRHGARDFASLSVADQTGLIRDLSQGRLEAEAWHDLPVSRIWSVCMRAALSEFYSHPWSWNEIGFGGPAYPRGYMRLGVGEREPREAKAADDEDPVQAADSELP